MKTTLTVLHISKVVAAGVRRAGGSRHLNGRVGGVGTMVRMGSTIGAFGNCSPLGAIHTRLAQNVGPYRTYSDNAGGIEASGTTSGGDITDGKPGGGGSAVVGSGEPVGDIVEPDGKPGGGGSARTNGKVGS
ncbi:hypothetical protein B0H19DRAFT_1141150, partial [Mycena capillaripes]